EINCDSLITDFPMATDNCDGEIIATTSDPLSYSDEGTYTITWTYTDSAGNESQQTQSVEVTCSNVGLNDYVLQNVNIYPNPTTDVLNIETGELDFEAQLMNAQGQQILKSK